MFYLKRACQCLSVHSFTACVTMGLYQDALKAAADETAAMKRKAEEDAHMNKVMAKMDVKHPKRKKKRVSSDEDEEESNDDEYEYVQKSRRRQRNRRSPSPPPPAHTRTYPPPEQQLHEEQQQQQQRNFTRKGQPKGVTEFLEYGKSVAPILGGGNPAQQYPFLRKRYKRSLRHTLRKMVTDDGPLNKLLRPDEHAMLKKNKAHVDTYLNSDDFSINPFEGAMSDVGKSVVSLLAEVEKADTN